MNCNLQTRINEKYPEEKIEVLEYTTMKEPAKVKCLSCGTEYSLMKAENFIRKGKNCICKKCINNHSGGRLDVESFQAKIDKKYPDEKLKVLNYTLKNEPCSIQCLTCKKIITLQNAESFVNRDKKRVCDDCSKNKRDQMETSINKFKDWMKEQDVFDFCFPFPEEIHSSTLVLSKCKRCGTISKKTIYDYMRGRGCGDCKKNTLKTIQQFQSEVGEDYQVLEYNGMDRRAKFKHLLCGFIYNANPRGYNCPRCRGSKGEKKIRYILTKKEIEFEEQKIWDIEGHKLRTDFYLPAFDKVIEYNGEQHYKPIDFFGGEETFKKQVYYDNLKKEYFADRLLVISYLDYDNIKDIISNSFL